MFTEQQLVSFGNYLLLTYGVQVHSTDGKNVPLYPRLVTDADFCNWKESQKEDAHTHYPSRYAIGDRVTFFCMPDDPTLKEFPGIPCEILAVHFYEGKVKYDLDLLFLGNYRSRIYNVDSVLVADSKYAVSTSDLLSTSEQN